MNFLGFLALILLFFGFVGRVLLGDFSSLLMNLHLGFGALFLCVWLYFVGLKNIRTIRYVAPLRSLSPWLTFFVFFLFLVMLNVLARKYNVSLDLTEQRVHSLSIQTEEIVKNLREPLQLIAIREKRGKNEHATERLFGYLQRLQPDLVTTRFIDPARNPVEVMNLGFQKGDKLLLTYGEKEKTVRGKLKRVDEQSIANAIHKLTRREGKRVYLLTGHGEPSFESSSLSLKSWREALFYQNIQVDTLLLGKVAQVPEDAAALVIIRPEKEYLDQELVLLQEYLDNGGRLFVAIDPRKGMKLRALLERYSVFVGDDVVVDQIQKLHESPKLGTQPLIQTYSQHQAVKQFSTETLTKLNLASSVLWKKVKDDAQKISTLLSTSDGAWAEKNLKLLLDTVPPLSSRDPEDLKGPVPVAVAYEKESARMIVFGDSDWLLDGNIDVFYNRDLASALFDWLVGYEDTIAIAERNYRASVKPISHSSFLVILTTSFLFPEILLIFGLYIWWKRRRY